MDIGIYSLNVTLYSLGPRFQEVEDRIHFILRFPSGILATVTSSFRIDRVHHYRVFGDKAGLDLGPATAYSSVIGNAETRIQHRIEGWNQFAAELDHIAECVRDNK